MTLTEEAKFRLSGADIDTFDCQTCEFSINNVDNVGFYDEGDNPICKACWEEFEKEEEK